LQVCTVSRGVGVLLVLGCSSAGKDVPTEVVSGPATLHVAAQPSASDTALARPDAALIVELRQDGTAKARQEIQFESISSPDGYPGFFRLTLASAPQSAFGTLVTDTTDDLGHASARIRLGSVAGQARMVVRSLALGIADTLQFTVLPGNASRIVLSVRDTALKPGESFTVSAYATDQSENRRPDVPTFAAGPNVASVDASGRITTMSSVGRGAVAVRAGGVVDSARFIVMPSFTMGFVQSPAFGEYSIGTAKMDGSELKLLAGVTTPAYPVFSPDGRLIAYEQGKWGEAWTIYVLDELGTKRRLVDPDTVPIAQYPHFSGDGQYIYFGGKARGGDNLSVWRVRIDGTELTRVAQSQITYLELHIGVAPDGSRIAFADPGLNVLDVATSDVTSTPMEATFVEFSPDSRRLAIMLPDRIRIMSFDGRAPVDVAVGRVSNDAGLAWTADGQWLVVRGGTGPVIIDVETGATGWMGLPNVYQISVKP
jgi:hypothetical protein